jgi:threonine dehydratase
LVNIVDFTPLLPLHFGDTILWCKCESRQPMGAFKLGGAWHRLSAMSEAERAGGVVAFSSGNHAQGVAWAARRLGMAAQRGAVLVPSFDDPRVIEGQGSAGIEKLTPCAAVKSPNRLVSAQASIAGASVSGIVR